MYPVNSTTMVWHAALNGIGNKLFKINVYCCKLLLAVVVHTLYTYIHGLYTLNRDVLSSSWLMVLNSRSISKNIFSVTSLLWCLGAEIAICTLKIQIEKLSIDQDV